MPILCGDFNDFLCLTLTWEMIQFDEHISRSETTKACFACFDELTGHAYSLFKQSVAVWWCSSFLGMNMVDKKRCLVRLRCVFFPSFLPLLVTCFPRSRWMEDGGDSCFPRLC